MAIRLLRLTLAAAAAAVVVLVWAPHAPQVARAAAALTGEGSCDPASVRPNSLVLMTCTTRLTNEGDAAATNLTANIGLASDCGIPANFAFLDSTLNGELVAMQPQALSFAIPDIPAGQTNVRVTRVVIVNGSGTGRTGGSISVTSQDDPAVRFSGDICWDVSDGAADPPEHLQVTKQALTTFAPPGPIPAQAQFEIDVSNVSDQEMTNVNVLDAPLNSSTVVTSDPPATGTDALGRPTWSLGTLAAGEERRIVATLGGSCVYADSIALATATSSGGTTESYPTLPGPSVPVGCTQPVNTTQANATVITSLPYADGPVALIGTPEPGAPHPSCSYYNQGPSLWYRYDATEDGVLIADTAGSTASAVLGVWQDSGSGLTEVDCSIGYPSVVGSSQARSAFHATAGQTYVFQVIGTPYATTAPPSVAFHLASGISPANDSFSNLTAIGSLPFSDSVDTTAATTQFGEPQPSCAYGIKSTVWYRYSAAQDTLLVADTIGSDYDATIGVWTDSKFGLAAVDCASAGSSGFPGPIGTAQPQPARLVVHAEAGKNYYFQIGGGSYGPSFGHLSFQVAVGAPPANDDFANATAISSLPFTDTVDALTATTEPGEPAPSCFGYGALDRTVWYRYTPSQDGYLEASSELPAVSYIPPPLAIYTGNSVDQLTEVSCSPAFSSENEIGFRVSAGETYYFQVTAAISIGPGLRAPGSAGGDTTPPQQGLAGQVTFHLDTLAVPSCAPPQATAQDAAGDVAPFGFPPAPGANAIDITSIAGGADGVNYCVQLQFADPLPAPDPPGSSVGDVQIGFDTDNNPATGYSGFCPGEGIDQIISFQIPSGVLIPIYQNFGPGPSPQGLYAFALVGERSVTLIVPLGALGGSGQSRFVAGMLSPAGLDCAPDHGTLPSQPAPSGDANCDGQVDSIDSLVVLQYTAGLVATLPCPQAADVTNSGDVGPIDATLILQYSSGMLPALPVSLPSLT